MKYFFVLILFFAASNHFVMADGGTNYSTAVIAVVGTNHSAIGHQFFKYTATQNGKIIITNCGKTTYSAYLCIKTDSLSTNVLYGQNYISFDGTSGTTYYIIWSCYSGGYDWTLNERNAISGEDCSTATTAIKGINHCNHSGIADQWFKYTPASDELLLISSCGYTSVRTSFIIYTGNCNTFDYIKYDSEACSSLAQQSKKTIKVLAGETYWIKWKSLGLESIYDWALEEIPLPKGTVCTDPIPASEGINDVYHYDNSVDQWFSYTPNINGLITLSRPENAFASVNVYKSSCNGMQVACLFLNSSYNKVTFYADSGITYLMDFSSYDSDLLHWKLTLTSQEPTEGSSCKNPIPAVTGANKVTNLPEFQWYSYTSPDSGKLTLSTNNSYSVVKVYDNCDGNIISSSSEYGSDLPLILDVIKNKKYLICWSRTLLDEDITWQLESRKYNREVDIKEFSFKGITRNSIINTADHTVQVTIGKTQSLMTLTPSFFLSNGASAYINNVKQVSDTTQVDFTNSVTYKIIAEDNITFSDWIVSVVKASDLSTEKKLTSFSLAEEISPATFDTINHTIIDTIIYDRDLTSLVATFSSSALSSVYNGAVQQISGITINNFTTPQTFTVKAEDGSLQDWTITVVNQAKPHGETCADGATAIVGVNKGNPTYPYQWFSYTPSETGMIKISAETGGSLDYIYANCFTEVEFINTDSLICAVEAGNTYNFAWYGLEGNKWFIEKLGLNKEKQIQSFQILGQSESPVIDTLNHLITATIEPYYNLSTLNQYFTVSTGAKVYVGNTQIKRGDVMDFTKPVIFNVVAQDGSSSPDWTVKVTKRNYHTGNNILAFSLPQQSGKSIIDTINHTVTIGVIEGADLSHIIPYGEFSPKAAAIFNSFLYYDFELYKIVLNLNNPVTVKVQSESGVAQNWVVTAVTGNVKSHSADITSFRLNEQKSEAIIDTKNATIRIEVKEGTNCTHLVPAFYLSPGASAMVESITQKNEVSSHNFLSPATYTVIAEDGVTTKTWMVSVTNAYATLAVSSDTINLNAQEDSTTNFQITSNTDWKISCDQNWLTLSNDKGSNNSTINLTATANPNTTMRSAIVTISGTGVLSRTIVVIQEAKNVTGITNLTDNNRIYPNPSSAGLFLVRLNTKGICQTKIEVYDMQGKQIVSHLIKVNGEQIIPVDLTTYPSGMYFLRIIEKGKISNTKIIVK
jgi:hypothetical protein